MREEVTDTAWSNPGRHQGGGSTGAGPAEMRKFLPALGMTEGKEHVWLKA